MGTQWVTEVLGRSELFAEVDREVLTRLAGAAGVVRLAGGERLFAAGDPGDALYCIAEGKVAFSTVSKRGERVLLSELAPPDTFGELALFHGGARTATAEAVEDCVLITVSRERLLDVMAHEPAAVGAMMRVVGDLVQRLTRQFADREQRLIAQVAKLQVEIDQARRERDVAMLTDNDDFRALREKAERMRKDRAERGRGPTPATGG